MSIKVAVFNCKGGVGKTTLAIILTQIALMKNQSVLAVDQDEQNNFNVSISYLQKEARFRDLFTFKTSLTPKDFDTYADWMIIDCPTEFNDRSRLAIRNADFVLIPVRADHYSTLHISKIRQAAGDFKYSFQFPLVKVGFVEGSVHDKSQAAKMASSLIAKRKYTVIGDLPLYENINKNISSDLKKWWSVGLSAQARYPFELFYKKLVLLYRKLQMVRKNAAQLRNKGFSDVIGYYDDPQNPDIQIFGLRSMKSPRLPSVSITPSPILTR